jgi:DNA-binding NtrC family response regulator
MQIKTIFISDKFDSYQNFIRQENLFRFNMELMSHADANRRFVYRSYYDLFVIDLNEDWLAIPRWIKEQGQHQYFFQCIFISDHPLNRELYYLLGRHIHKVINRQTATDSLLKVLDVSMQFAVDHRYESEPAALKATVFEKKLLGEHPQIVSINNFIRLVSKARHAPCLIRGEAGTGKNICAHLIHSSNNLRDDLFFEKNCEGATTNELLGDLFGAEDESHAFGPQRRGLLEQYANGTIVLKNIEKLPPDVQDKLLLYLEERNFRPLGGTRIVESNVRIIALTRHNLEWFVKHQNFNSNLFYHLKAFEIHLPEIHERLEDLTLLINYFMQNYNQLFGKRIKSISDQAMRILKTYRWPGNIKELKDVLERTVFICNSEQITVNELPEFLRGEQSITPEQEEYLGNCSIRDIERIHIERVLSKTNGNKSKAAALLEISRTTLREKMRQYSLETK